MEPPITLRRDGGLFAVGNVKIAKIQIFVIKFIIYLKKFPSG